MIRSKGLGSAAKVTPAQARREREAFTVARREGLEFRAFRFHKPRGERSQSQPTNTLQTTPTNGASAIGPDLKALVRSTRRRWPTCQ